jgi:hypothetical protein
MRYLVPGWAHRPGVHCASTALADLMTFQRQPLSEAMCFGLGCGLGFAYLEGGFMSPSRMTATRSRLLEPRFFEKLGQPFAWRIDPDPAHAWTTAREHLLAGRPLLLRADLAHLPYYQSKSHFAGHVILLWGFDDEAGAALVTDTHLEGVQEVPLSDLTLARYGGMGYLKNTGEHFIPEPTPIGDLRPVLRRALRHQAEDLIGMKLDLPGAFGLEGMKRAAAAMPTWSATEDWAWSARWLYQVIEKRGTGGGAFRLLYAKFLAEAAALDPELASRAPAAKMKEIAAAWTELSYILKDISDGPDPAPLAGAGAKLARIAEQEERFFRGLMI